MGGFKVYSLRSELLIPLKLIVALEQLLALQKSGVVVPDGVSWPGVVLNKAAVSFTPRIGQESSLLVNAWDPASPRGTWRLAISNENL